MSVALAIHAKSISKKYGEQKILDNATLEVPAASLNLIVGKNGSGKSTLMRMLSGCERFEGEGIWHNGKNLDDERTEALNSFGFVSEDITYKIGLALKDYPKFFSEIYPNWKNEVFEGILARLRIDTSRDISSYSRGQKMQIVFAVNAASQPKIFLLDEITSVLDADARAFIMEWLQAWSQAGNTVLLSSNMVSEAQSFVTHLHYIDGEKIYSLSDFHKLYAAFHKMRGFGSESKVFSHPECIVLRANSDGSRSFLIKKEFVKEGDIASELLDRRAPTLEDFFIYQTRKGVLL